METMRIIVSALKGIQYIWHVVHSHCKYEWYEWVVPVDKVAKHRQENHVYWPQDFSDL